MNRLSLGWNCDGWLDQLVDEYPSEDIDDSNVDDIIESESNAGGFCVDKEDVRPRDKRSCPIECLSLAGKWPQVQPPKGDEAERTARYPASESSWAIARATTSSTSIGNA